MGKAAAGQKGHGLYKLQTAGLLSSSSAAAAYVVFLVVECCPLCSGLDCGRARMLMLAKSWPCCCARGANSRPAPSGACSLNLECCRCVAVLPLRPFPRSVLTASGMCVSLVNLLSLDGVA